MAVSSWRAQLELAASVVPQLLDSPNGPVTPIDDIDAAADPLLLMVTVREALIHAGLKLTPADTER